MKKKLLTLGIVLALVAVLATPMAVLAQTGTTGVSGNLPVTYSLQPPTAIVLGPFVTAGPYASADDTVIATTNDGAIASVDIGVKDATTNAGFLTNAVGFDVALQAKGGDVGAYTDVSATDIMLETAEPLAGPGSYTIPDFSVSQTISTADLAKAAGVYSTTLTFTATFNP